MRLFALIVLLLGMSNSERNRVALNNGLTGTELIDSGTTGAHENFTSTVPNGAECAAKCKDHGCGNFMCGGVNCGCASCEHGCPWKCGTDGKCPRRIPCMVPQCSMCEIKGKERKMPVNSLAYCKSLCLKTHWCKGIDYSTSNTCYLNEGDVKVVGTKFDPFYKAFRKDTCLEGSQVENGEESIIGASEIMEEANVMDGQRNGVRGIRGGYDAELEGGAGGLGVGDGLGFGSGNQGRHNLGMACTDELPSDYINSICYNTYNFKSCEKIAKMISGCNDLWKDTECSNHTGHVRDTCRKSCDPSCQETSPSVNVLEGSGLAVGLTGMGDGYGNNEEVFGVDGMGGGNRLTSGSDVQGSCEDFSKRCGALANPGKCKTDPSVQRYCKKSCGLCGWNKVAVRGKAWDDNQCSRLGMKIIIDGIKTEGKACKGYCNDFGSKRCNAINWNPQISRCIAWSCGKPIPIPTRIVHPGYEAYTREEQGSGVGLTSIGGGHGNDEDAFGGNGIGDGNGQTSGIDSQVSGQLEESQLDASFFGCRGSKITLKTQYSDAKFIRALPDKHRVNANGTSADNGIQFEVEDLGALPKGARKIALKSIYGKYLTAKKPAMGPLESYPVSNVTAHSTWLWKGAKFEVKHNANNLYWFKTAWKVDNKSRYLLPYTNGYIRGDGKATDLRRWAKFTPECVEGSADVQTRMGGDYDNNEEVFGGDGMRGGNGLTSGSNVQGRPWECMLKECSMCEIKGHEVRQAQVNDLARCKAICLTTFWCKGIDFGFNQCFLTREDVRVVGTKFNPMYTAYRVGTCSGAVGSGAPTGGNHLWSPNVETVLKYKSNDLTSMLQNNQQLDQLNVPSPITMEADVKVQAFRDETLRVKFEHTKFYSQNEEVSVSNAHRILDMISSENGHGRHAAHIFKTSLEQPMMIQVKNGQAKDVLVNKNELDCVSKIKLMLVKDLMQNVENQQLNVVKKESIMKPFDLSRRPKKINLNM